MISFNRRLHDSKFVKHNLVFAIDALHFSLANGMVQSDLAWVHLL